MGAVDTISNYRTVSLVLSPHLKHVSGHLRTLVVRNGRHVERVVLSNYRTGVQPLSDLDSVIAGMQTALDELREGRWASPR